MEKINPLLQNLNQPSVLEEMYRKNAIRFENDFHEAWSLEPDSIVLAVWKERLQAEKASTAKDEISFPENGGRRELTAMAVLAFISATLGRILLECVKQQICTPVNIVYVVMVSFAVYFLLKNRPNRKITLTLCALLAFSGIYLNLLPLEEFDSVILSYLHLPVFLWVLLGLAFTGNRYGDLQERTSFIKFNVEFGLMYAAMALGGILVTSLTLSLFSLIGMDIAQLYFENVVLLGAIGLSVVAVHFASREKGYSGKIASHLAKIFSPLILATLLVYLAMVLVTDSNPFIDRNFLLTFNGVLLFILAVTMFFIIEAEENPKIKLFDWVHVSLISLALVVDSVAFSAIAFRLTSYGITPNRLAVLGLNSLVWIHLAWILLSYVRYLRKTTDRSVLQNAVTKYLPVYGLWAGIVAFIFPLIFPY